MTHIFNDFTTGGRRTWPLAVPFLLVIFFIVGDILTILPVKFTGLITRENIDVYPYIVYFLIVSFAAAFGALYLWVRYFEHRSMASIGLAMPDGTLMRFVRGHGLGVAMGTVSVLGIWAFGAYSLEVVQDFSLVSYGPILILLFAFIIQSSVEEILFRGWMLERLSSRYGLWVGILGNATLFTLMHLDGEEMALVDTAIFLSMTFAFSIFLSLLVVRQESIWGACAWHAGWNWVFITCFGLPTTGIALDVRPLFADLMISEGAPNWMSGGVAGPENSVVTLTILMAGIMLLLRARQKARTSADAEGAGVA